MRPLIENFRQWERAVDGGYLTGCSRGHLYAEYVAPRELLGSLPAESRLLFWLLVGESEGLWTDS